MHVLEFTCMLLVGFGICVLLLGWVFGADCRQKIYSSFGTLDLHVYSARHMCAF